jgi:hypothetical protein
MPAAAPLALDAPALVNRAVGRELDGDHVGAVEDVRAALALETDPDRRAALQGLLPSLESPP